MARSGDGSGNPAAVLPQQRVVPPDGGSGREPIGRGFDLWIGRKRDREGISRIAVFLPSLCGCRAAGDKCREGEGDQAHVWFLSAVFLLPLPACLKGVYARLRRAMERV